MQTIVGYAVYHKQKCGIVNISNEIISNASLFSFGDNALPYLSLTQANSAYKFMINEGISKEYKKLIDVLNIQLSPFYNECLPKHNFLYISPKKLVSRVCSMIGHFKGTHHITVTHSIFSLLINIHPRLKNKILFNLSKKICNRINLETFQE